MSYPQVCFTDISYVAPGVDTRKADRVNTPRNPYDAIVNTGSKKLFLSLSKFAHPEKTRQEELIHNIGYLSESQASKTKVIVRIAPYPRNRARTHQLPANLMIGFVTKSLLLVDEIRASQRRHMSFLVG